MSIPILKIGFVNVYVGENALNTFVRLPIYTQGVLVNAVTTFVNEGKKLL